MIRILSVVLIMGFILGCSAIPVVGTRMYVYEKLQRIQIGHAPEQIMDFMDGPPSYVTSLPQGPHMIDVWEYRVGNFIHEKPAIIVVKDKRVIAIPQSSQELLGVLYSNGIIMDAQFWNHQNA